MSDENREHSVPIRVWVNVETASYIESIAAATGRNKSSIYREMIDRGLVASGYRSTHKNTAQLVREVVTEVMKPNIERLASISAKGTQLSAAAFFLSAYVGRQNVPEALLDTFDSIAAQARKLGIEYLKLSKDQSLDEFIADGLSKMGEDS